ncbi:unnamed protein product [Onchocerca flexuosa]|uniref:PRELI/MSF1 domain-containing protein n=1 Tax=Onchocerca flexuosa TaxID=387005 RepID=A0A183I1N7_9BILA|nr:unnamed protein product [Onchocerca flexuosa]
MICLVPFGQKIEVDVYKTRQIGVKTRTYVNVGNIMCYFVYKKRKMYRNETLQLEGDSIWGSITLLLSSLTGRPCTGPERAQFYEDILLKSLEKQEKAMLSLLKFSEIL